MVASISWPFSSFTLNMAFERASMIVPSCLIRGCFDIYFWGRKDRRITLKKEKSPINFPDNPEKIGDSGKTSNNLAIRAVPAAPWSCPGAGSEADEHREGN